MNQQPSSKVLKALKDALENVEHSPDLDQDEHEFVRYFALRLATEFTVLKNIEQESENLEPEAA